MLCFWSLLRSLRSASHLIIYAICFPVKEFFFFLTVKQLGLTLCVSVLQRVSILAPSNNVALKNDFQAFPPSMRDALFLETNGNYLQNVKQRQDSNQENKYFMFFTCALLLVFANTFSVTFEGCCLQVFFLFSLKDSILSNSLDAQEAGWLSVKLNGAEQYFYLL